MARRAKTKFPVVPDLPSSRGARGAGWPRATTRRSRIGGEFGMSVVFESAFQFSSVRFICTEEQRGAGSGLNTVHLRPVRPELVEGPSYAARLRQAQPERIKLAK